MNTSVQERRLFTRITFDKNATITQGNKNWDAELIDLSLNGLLISEPKGWDKDPDQDFVAKIPLDENVIITMAIKLKHTEQGHVGFQCLHIDIDSISHLRRLVELNLGDLSLLERQLAALGR